MQWAGVIVPIAVIAVLAIIVLIVFLYIRARLKNFSRQAFGTDDLGKAVNQIQNASEQPRTVHGMTDIYLPAIQRDFPEFDYEVFKSRAQGVLRSYFAAISATSSAKPISASSCRIGSSYGLSTPRRYGSAFA